MNVATRPIPAFSLVVCTMGRQDELIRLLESLAAQNFNDFQVIIVDQNPPGFLDAVIEQFRPRIDIVQTGSRPGLSGARNVGLERARGRLIAFPDDDCWYPANTLRDVLAMMNAHKDAAIVSGMTIDSHGHPSLSPALGRPAIVTRRNYLLCGNSNTLFFRREVFKTVGGFDTRLGVGTTTAFQSGEESDLILRALDAGLLARYVPDLRIHHDQVDSDFAAGQIRRAAGYGHGFGALMRKHRFPVYVVAYRIVRPVASACRYWLLGRRALARYKWTWGCSIAKGY